MMRIALIPVYNEESTLLPVLESLESAVDAIVLVDDGSRDRSLDVARNWASRHRGTVVLHLPENRGMSSALREGFAYLAGLLAAGTLASEDMLLTIDADGQHDAREIRGLCEHMDNGGFDVALTRRDFSLYPAHKRLGNYLMTLWGRMWSGFCYSDVESGFRAMRLKVLPPLLDYYTGCRYSCAQEIAVLTCRLGFRVDNSFKTVIRLYRSQTGARDVLINAALGFWAFARCGLQSKVSPRTALARPVIQSGPT